MYEWQNSGPSPLDLVTPLAQGVQAGQEAANRSEKIRSDMANEAQMKAALGLQQNQLDFQKSVYAAGAGLRSAQLQIATANAGMATTQADQTAQGQPVLNDFLTKLNTMDDPDEINNTSVPSGLSEQQQQQAISALSQKRGTQAAALAADAASKLHLNQVNQVSAAVEAGIDPTQYQKPDGTQDYVALGNALTAHTASIADAAEKRLESRDTNKQIAIGVRQNDYLNTKSQLEAVSPKMSDIDKLTFTAAKAKVDGAIRAKSALLNPTPENTAPYDQAIAEGQMDMQTLKGKYNASTMAPAAGTSPMSGTLGTPGATAASSRPQTATNPATGQKFILQGGQWVPAK